MGEPLMPALVVAAVLLVLVLPLAVMFAGEGR